MGSRSIVFGLSTMMCSKVRRLRSKWETARIGGWERTREVFRPRASRWIRARFDEKQNNNGQNDEEKACDLASERRETVRSSSTVGVGNLMPGMRPQKGQIPSSSFCPL